MSALVCPDCGRAYKAVAGHCRGGRWGGCCRSFAANRDFDAHRVGSFEPNQRRCLTDDELLARGWQVLDGFWASPATVVRKQDAASRIPVRRGGPSSSGVDQ